MILGILCLTIHPWTAFLSFEHVYNVITVDVWEPPRIKVGRLPGARLIPLVILSYPGCGASRYT